jgi:transcriptional regulator with XRE-family HTH domain
MAAPLHEAIRTARLGAGLSLRSLAGMIGVSPGTMSAVETGKTAVSVHRLQRIAEVLDVDLRTLIATSRRSSPHRRGQRQPIAPATGEVSWRDFPAIPYYGLRSSPSW